MKTNHQSGFTLIEVMIVVAIIGLLAAVAIPNLLRARMNSNEGAIKYDLKTFCSANESYRAGQSTPSYATAIADLTGATPAYLDTTWDSASRHGYNLTYTAAVSTYGLLAAAISANDANNDYALDQTGVITKSSAGGISCAATGCTGGTPLR